jgi:hypothetical protein
MNSTHAPTKVALTQNEMNLVTSSLGFVLANLEQFNASIGLSKNEGVTQREVEKIIMVMASKMSG